MVESAERTIRLSTARNGVYRAKNKLLLARVRLVNFAGGPKLPVSSILLLFSSFILVFFPSFRLFFVHRGLRSWSFRWGVPRMSSPKKARKSLHLLRAFCPYLEREYTNLDSSKRGTRWHSPAAIALWHCLLWIFNFMFLHTHWKKYLIVLIEILVKNWQIKKFFYWIYHNSSWDN